MEQVGVTFQLRQNNSLSELEEAFDTEIDSVSWWYERAVPTTQYTHLTTINGAVTPDPVAYVPPNTGKFQAVVYGDGWSLWWSEAFLTARGPKPDSVPWAVWDSLFFQRDTVILAGFPRCDSLNAPKYQTSGIRIVASGWCFGKDPTGTSLTRLNSALTRMRALGGRCDTLGLIGQRLLAKKRIRILTVTENTWTHGLPSGAANRIGGDTAGYFWLKEEWFTQFYDSAHYERMTDVNFDTVAYRSLQGVLAHEVGHLHGDWHLASNLPFTQSEFTCDDLPGGRLGGE